LTNADGAATEDLFVRNFSGFDYVVAPEGSCVHHVRDNFDAVEQTDQVKEFVREPTSSSSFCTMSREMLWGGRRGWQFRRLHQSMECRDASAERFEQVPGGAGPR
jgi:hypothetical protein